MMDKTYNNDVVREVELPGMKTMKKLAFATGLFFSLFAGGVSHALIMTNPSMSLEQLTKSADDIVIGNVVSVEPRVVGKSFETSYQIQVSESLKSGNGSKSAAGNVITMTLPGAALTTPPLTQYVSGVPYMAKGENVLLFLKSSAKPEPEQLKGARSLKDVNVPLVPSSAKVVGWNQGRFSLVTDPSTGEKMVTRINLESYGMMNSGRDTAEILSSLESNRLKLVKREALLRAADQASAARSKDPLEMTNKDAQNLKVEKSLQRGSAINEARERGGIPAQTLNSFKSDINKFVNQ